MPRKDRVVKGSLVVVADDGTVTRTCGAKTRSGKPCNQPAGFGTGHNGFGHCKYHGGCTAAHNKQAAREEVQERVAVMRGMGGRVTLDPKVGLLQEYYRSVGHVQWMEQVISEWGYGNPRELLLQLDPVRGYEKAAYLKVYQEERRHAATVAKWCIEAGVAERLIALAETQAEMLNSAITSILTRLGLNVADEGVRRVVGSELALIAAKAV